jgi:hypothetical protein
MVIRSVSRLLCVSPSSIQRIKWHPEEPNTLAVATETKIFLVNLDKARASYTKAPITKKRLTKKMLSKASVVLAVALGLADFAFDTTQSALGTITTDSTLTLWRIEDKQPLWSEVISDDHPPSSLKFIDGGVLIGRGDDTAFQLLPAMSNTVSATIRFCAPSKPASFMTSAFGVVEYNPHAQMLWVATNQRGSLFGLQLGFEGPVPGGRPFVQKVVEFGGINSAIDMSLLPADMHPRGSDAEAVCTAAGIPVDELVRAPFIMHSAGIQQVVLPKAQLDAALERAPLRRPHEVYTL